MSYSQTPEPSEREAAGQVLRRASDVSSAFELSEIDCCDVDLREDYENAVQCVVQCESVIKALHARLDARDQEMALLREAKDREIEELEKKLVDMSFELASTKSREDQLQHKLTIASSVVHEDISVAIAAARYRPQSKNNRSRPKRCALDDSLKSSLATEATAKSSFTSDATNNDVDGSNTSRLSNMGRFLVQHCSWKESGGGNRCDVQVGFPKSDAQETVRVNHFPKARESGHIQRIAMPTMDLDKPKPRRRKSSRTFLEESGVVFPVSSFDVMTGCLIDSVNEGSKGRSNAGWPELK